MKSHPCGGCSDDLWTSMTGVVRPMVSFMLLAPVAKQNHSKRICKQLVKMSVNAFNTL